MNKIRFSTVLPASAVVFLTAGLFAASAIAAEDPFIADMRKQMAREAIANSTDATEQSIKQKARVSAECSDLGKVREAQAEKIVIRHMPPDPTKIIENKTCFMDVQKIKIPSTGIGFADEMLSGLVKFGAGQCAKNNMGWNDVVTAVKNKDWSRVKSELGEAKEYVQSSAGNIWNSQTPAPVSTSGPVASPTPFVPSPVSNYPGSTTPQSPQTSQAPQPSLSDRLWGKLTGPGD